MKKLTTILLLTSSMLFADSILSQEFSDCMDKSDGSTYSMIECTNSEYELQDKRLNLIYKNLMKNLEDSKKSELKKVQRIWIEYKEAKCNFYSDLTGGTIDSINVAECFAVETARRANELEGFSEH